MEIKVVPAAELYPFIGYANPDGLIEIADCLDIDEYDFVRLHEIFHTTDEARWWVWREIKANVYAGWHHPKGFFKVVWRTAWDFKRIYTYLTQKGQKASS